MIALQKEDVKENYEGTLDIHPIPQPQPQSQSDISFLQGWFKNCVSGFTNEGYINLRFVQHGRYTVSMFYRTSEMNIVEMSIKSNTSENNIFFAVCTRIEKGGPGRKGGRKEGIKEIPGLWVDIDIKHLSKEQKVEVYTKIKEFPLQPTFVVNSGNGNLHIYWRFKETLPASDIWKVEMLNRRLVTHLHGDSKSAEAAHVMRAVGSRNFKYDNHPIVKIVTSNPDNEFEADDFDQLLPPSKQEKKEMAAGEEFLNQSPIDAPDAEQALEQAMRIGIPGCRNMVGSLLALRLLNLGLDMVEAHFFTTIYWKHVHWSSDRPPYEKSEMEASLRSAYQKDRRNSEFAHINWTLRQYEKEHKGEKFLKWCQKTEVSSINNNKVLRNQHRFCDTNSENDGYSTLSECEKGTVKYIRRRGKSNITINTPASCHRWDCEKPGCARENGRRWKGVIEFNYSGHAYAVTISENEIPSWVDTAQNKGARTFTLWSGESHDYLFLADLFLQTRRRDSAVISGEKFSLLVDKYLQREKAKLDRRKIGHSNNILYPHSTKFQSDSKINEFYDDSEGKEQPHRRNSEPTFPVYFRHNSRDEIDEAEVSVGGKIIKKDERVTVMESTEKVVKKYRSKMDGKVEPMFSDKEKEESLIYKGTVQQRRRR